MRHWQGTAQARGALTAIVDEVEVRGVVEAMEAIAAQLGRRGGELKAFAGAVERYRNERDARRAAPAQADDSEESEDGSGEASTASRVIAQAALGGAALLPGVSVLAGMASPEIAAQGLDRLRTGFRERGRRDPLSEEPVKALSTVFVQELAGLAEEHTWLVLFFDTWEQTGRYLDTWIRDLLLDACGPMPANVLVVLAGQNELGEREWAELRGQITDVPLDVFTEQEARALLAARGVSGDESKIQEILHLSMGLPLLVDTLAHIDPGSSDDPTDAGHSVDVAVARFVRWIPDPDEQATVLSCALPVQLNEDIFHVVVPDTAAGRYGWLCQQPFVTGHGTHRQYHDVVRTSMLRYLQTRSPLVWAERHTQLADAYAAWRATTEENLKGRKRWADLDWRTHRGSETYHRLCADPRRHLTSALEDTVHAASEDLSVLRRWIDILARVGRDTGHPLLTQWSERLTSAVAGAQPFLDTLLVLLTAPDLTARVRAQAHTHRGWHLHLADRDSEAITAYGQALNADPDFTLAFIRRGITHRSLGRFDEALADSNRAIEISPDAGAVANRGETCRLMGRYDEALADFNRAIELVPNYRWALTSRSQTYRAMGRYDDALTDLNRAAELDPTAAWISVGRGQTYRLMGRYDDALTDFNRAIELDPTAAWIIAGRGRIYQLMGRYDDALTDLNRAIELDPTATWIIAGRGGTYRRMGRYDDALTDLNHIIELDPQADWAIANCGETYRLMGRYDDALTDFNRAIELNPLSGWAIASRGETYRAMGRYDDALTDLNRAIELDPTAAWISVGRGRIYQLIGRYDDALTDLNRAIELNPEYAWAITGRGQTYRLMGRYNDALTDLNHIIELNPLSGWAFYERALTHRCSGRSNGGSDLARAVELFTEDAEEADSQGANGRGNLVVAYCAMTHWADAERALTVFLEPMPPHSNILELITDLDQLLLTTSSGCEPVLRYRERLLQALDGV
ncbi:tetratricopeptide repeat protein [Streptomyces sp. NPDC060366]|uniref:tetratricopeptide repeat protein n=1 Tax=Streptomyces sp. NPDC060366 TaxID=3347105 RepID=UPI00365DC863